MTAEMRRHTIPWNEWVLVLIAVLLESFLILDSCLSLSVLSILHLQHKRTAIISTVDSHLNIFPHTLLL